MTDIDTKEPLSNVSDSSFIILGQGSLPPSIENEITDAEFPDKNQNTFVVLGSNKSFSNTPSRMSDSQSYSEDNIQEKLQQLVRENNQLKETLIQNNLAIRSQLDTFYMWQQEVLKTHESHKEKFLETKDLILKLRAENLHLRKQLTEGFWTISDGDDLTEKSNKCDCGILKKESDKMKSMCEELTSKNETLEKENMKLREKSEAAEKEVLRLNSELEDVLKENKFLKQKNDDLLKTSSMGSLNNELLQNSKAQPSMKTYKEAGVENSEITGQASVLEKVDEYLKNLDDLKISFDCQSKGFNTLQSWVALAEENPDSSNKNLLGEIKELKSHISQEEKTCKDREENLQELKDQFNTLLEDYKVLQQQLSSIQNKDSDTEKYKNEVSNLSQQLETKEQELLLKQQECSELKEEIKKLNLKCEEMTALKFQLELYQSDFNEERAAREKLVGEKEAMAEQLRHLQSKLEAVEKGLAEEEREENGEKSQPFFRPYEVSKNRFVCPKCMFAFGDLKRCEEHVEECLNIHFYP